MGALAARGATPRIGPFSGSLGAYAALATAGFRRYATYRQATAAGLFTNSVFGFMRCYALLAVVGAAGPVAGYTGPRLMTYVWLGQAMLAVVNIWGAPDLQDRIRTGDVVIDLLRPVNPVWQYLAGDLGRAAYAVLVRATVPLLIGALAFDLYAPRHLVTYPLFALSLLLAVVIGFGCRYLVHATAFWLLDARGPHLAWVILAGVLSGLYFPLWFLPEIVVRILVYATPLPSLLQTPTDVAVERADPLPLIGAQVGWAVMVLAAAQYVQRRAERRMVVQGG